MNLILTLIATVITVGLGWIVVWLILIAVGVLGSVLAVSFCFVILAVKSLSRRLFAKNKPTEPITP